MTEPFWTDARIEELKTRWANWETFTEIAVALGHRSRNAVIGKAHRLGLRRDGELPQHNQPGRRRTRPPKQPRRIVVRINGRRHFVEGETMTQAEDPPPGFANAKRFIELDAADCHWPGAGVVGPDLLCCAAPALDGYPYCLHHCRIAYNAVPLKRIKVP